MSNPETALRIVKSEEPIETTTSTSAHQQTIRDCVESAMRNYFTQLDGHNVNDVYQMVLTEVEVPLLEVVLEYTRNNQSRAAEVLGLNRGTLRKKLKQYDML
ncbi:MAG TPA: DNA-binding transcriptional regulator Fis [Pseudomonadales bacterium]|nr:DNA-binding transcriptional regulator Fis [Pseudomonadales bacterium]